MKGGLNSNTNRFLKLIIILLGDLYCEKNEVWYSGRQFIGLC